MAAAVSRFRRPRPSLAGSGPRTTGAPPRPPAAARREPSTSSGPGPYKIRPGHSCDEGRRDIEEKKQMKDLCLPAACIPFLVIGPAWAEAPVPWKKHDVNSQVAFEGAGA